MSVRRKVLITGALGGIGWALAEAFGREGYDLVLSDVLPNGGNAQARADALGARYEPVDLARPEQVASLGDRLAEVGGVDVLINNAGLQHVAPVDEFPDDVWQQMIQVMLTAPFQLAKRLLPNMKQRGWGRIINIASIHGLVASPYKSAYVSAKHGLVGLTKTMALEVGGAGITVNAICPAYVRTGLVERQIADQARNLGLHPDEVIQHVMLEPAAVKRLIEPHEVAALALFLASETAGAMTGAVYTMDLGWTAR